MPFKRLAIDGGPANPTLESFERPRILEFLGGMRRRNSMTSTGEVARAAMARVAREIATKPPSLPVRTGNKPDDRAANGQMAKAPEKSIEESTVG